MTAPQHPPTNRSILDLPPADKRSSSCFQVRHSTLPTSPSAVEIKVVCEAADAKLIVAQTHSLESSIPPALKDKTTTEDNDVSTSDPSPPSLPSTKDSSDDNASDPPLPPDPTLLLHPLELAPRTTSSAAILTADILLTTPSTRANSPSASMGGDGGCNDDAMTFFDDIMNDSREPGTLALVSKGGGHLTPSPATSLPELYHGFFDNHPELCCESDQSSSDVEMMEHDLMEDEDAPVMIHMFPRAQLLFSWLLLPRNHRWLDGFWVLQRALVVVDYEK
ncbi:hypothetical protein KVV02_004084 [Mortierella alpina]|uniref:Uncharacterized protein n=1 Tax=Mortierella alpina TaxID=64518 RepID=A0A9P8A1K3_MORAP|nr:hypothetical protein KVV02_004084 [Mortierella alpina]